MIHTCKICNFSHEIKKKVSNHINSVHRMKTLDYTIQYLYDGVRPMCPECGKETRYESCAFRKYCIEHSYMAEQEAGRVGGKIKETWNKGKTKDDDERIAALGKKQSGEGNPFYGKKHSEESQMKISAKKRLTHEQIQDRVAKRANELTLVSDLSDYDTRQGTRLTFQCNECSAQLTVPLSYYERGAKCQKCHPAGSIEQK